MAAGGESIAPKIGCIPQTLHEWVREQELDAGLREDVTRDTRKNKALHRANNVLKLASGFVGQTALDRHQNVAQRTGDGTDPPD